MDPHLIAAAILAGGKARRLGGRVKGNLITQNNLTIMQHLLREIKTAAISDTVIIANDSAPYGTYGAKIIPDLWQDVGPLAGVASALHYYTVEVPRRCAAVLITPCDLPAFTAHEITCLVQTYCTSSAPIVFAATGVQEYHPLCAVVSCALLPQLQQALAGRKRKIYAVWQEFGAQAVLFNDPQKFRNINTMSDLMDLGTNFGNLE